MTAPDPSQPDQLCKQIATETSTATAGGAVAKMKADIGFLQERIALMQNHRHPNRAVLQTYQTMLARRETALAMLLQRGLRGQAPTQMSQSGG